jgi:membrane protein DedA with SNARE-associated domain
MVSVPCKGKFIVFMSASIEPAPVLVVILLAAFFAQALKEIGIPSPGLTQSLLLYAGYQFSCGEIHTGIGIILLTLLGSLCGACFIFSLARWQGNGLLAKLDRYILFNPTAMEKARNKITQYSFISLAITRSIPGLMVPTSIVAGVLRIPISKFIAGVIFPMSIWTAALSITGNTLGTLPYPIKFPTSGLLILFSVLIAFGILSCIVYKWRKNRLIQAGFK